MNIFKFEVGDIVSCVDSSVVNSRSYVIRLIVGNEREYVALEGEPVEVHVNTLTFIKRPIKVPEVVVKEGSKIRIPTVVLKLYADLPDLTKEGDVSEVLITMVNIYE